MKNIGFILLFGLFFCACEKSPSEVDDTQIADMLLEDQFDIAISLYDNSESLNKAFDLFNNVIENDTGCCFWKAYVYLANIHLLRNEFNKAKNMLQKGKQRFSNCPGDETDEDTVKKFDDLLQQLTPDSLLHLSVTGKDSTVFIPYDEPPQPIGGFASIQNKLKYPEDAREQMAEGTVIVQVFINRFGIPCKTRIQQPLPFESMNVAARKAVKATFWKPATQRGKPVGVWISIPVIFKIKEN